MKNMEQIIKDNNNHIQSQDFIIEQNTLDHHISLLTKSWQREGYKLINSSKVIFTYKEKKILKSLLMIPMPSQYRINFWLISSGARREMMNHPTYYLDITERYPKDIPSPYTYLIELDLPRTFPDDPFFQLQDNLMSLKNILVAYSRRSVTIGYCQGFNFIAGKIYKIVKSEEETFWLFTQIIESCLPADYFCELAEMMTDCTILNKLLHLFASDITDHIDSNKNEMYLNNAIYRWFMSLFIQNTSEEYWLVIWDMLMLEGNIVLFKAAIGILKICAKDILALNTAQDLQNLFNKELCQKNELKPLLYYLILKKYDFNMEIIKKSRETIFPRVIEGIRASGAFLNEPSSEVDIKCNTSWPLCLKDVKYRHEILRVFIYKPLRKPKVIANYCNADYNRDKERSKMKALYKEKNMAYDNLILERRSHNCNEHDKEKNKQNDNQEEEEEEYDEDENIMDLVQSDNHMNLSLAFYTERNKDENELTFIMNDLARNSVIDIKYKHHGFSKNNDDDDNDNDDEI